MPEICPVHPHDESEIPDLLHLAKMYAGGLGKLWKDKSEAARILAITYPRLTRAHLTSATSLAEYPPEVRDLFAIVGIGTWACRSLSKARRAQGMPALLEKASAIKAAKKNFSRAQIISILTSESGLDLNDLSTPRQFNPRKISETYQTGLREGRWSTLHGAASVLGTDKGVIAIACGFMDLPSQVKQLLLAKNCTYDICREILEIEKAIGQKSLAQRAHLISKKGKDGLSAEDLVRLLAGITHQSATVVPRIRIPRNQRKLVIEFHCDDSRFLLNRSTELMKIVETGLASLIEAALATLGAAPVVSKK